MKKRVVFLLLGLAIVVFGCSQERDLSPVAPLDQGTPTFDAAAFARAMARQAGWPIETEEADAVAGQPLAHGEDPPVLDFERTVITGHIVHYSMQVPVGPGQYDVIGIHRVVRENRPGRPIKTHKALFMLHGDLKNFATMFLPGQFSPHLPSDFGIAVYLAEHNIDVWGISQGWNFVPAEETDFSFFADWGIQREVDHLSAGLSIAREARALSGNGLHPMLLLGYSSGCVTGYALLNEEAQQPESERQVKGYIAADCGVRSDDEDWLACWEMWVPWYQELYDSGQYQDILQFRDAAFRARTDPDGPSPYLPGYTNWQCAMFFGGGLLFAPAVARYHAPILEDDFPVGFQHITTDQWLDFMENAAAYEPILFELEYSQLFAMYDSPFVSHLGDVTVPVLDIGGAGGIAPYTAATISYLGSTDITQLYISTGMPQELDYGHIDIFTGLNSPRLAWDPILHWVIRHSAPGQEGRDAPEEMALGD